MTPCRRSSRAARALCSAIAAALAGASLIGCGGATEVGTGGTKGLPTSTAYLGTVASTTGSVGSLSLTFATATMVARSGARPAGAPTAASIAPVAVTGTLVLDGTSVDLSGSLTDSTLQMSDEAGDWTVQGTLSGGVLKGSFTGPGGEAGSIAAMASSVGVPVLAYCGTYADTAVDNPEDTQAGSFTAVIAGAYLLGSVVTAANVVQDFSGTASGSSFYINQIVASTTLSASGSYSAASESDAGAFDGSYEVSTVEGAARSGGLSATTVCD